MHLSRIAAAVLLLSVSAPALAQDSREYVDKAERFGVSLPRQPAIREITYTSWRKATLPARVYTVEDGPGHYSVTVVNYATATDVTDVLGSIAFAAWNIRRKGGQITYDAYAQADRIEGHELHITHPDGSVTFAAIYLHARRLYILEATVPRGSVPPLEFQQSLVIFDEKGVRVRYEIDAEGQRTARVPSADQ